MTPKQPLMQPPSTRLVLGLLNTHGTIKGKTANVIIRTTLFHQLHNIPYRYGLNVIDNDDLKGKIVKQNTHEHHNRIRKLRIWSRAFAMYLISSLKISFKDITPLCCMMWRRAALVVDLMANEFRNKNIDVVAAIEVWIFIRDDATDKLNVPFVPHS